MDSGTCLVLLTYKGKILLTRRDSSPIVQSPWCFIEGKKEKNKSIEETISTRVEKETSLKLASFEFLSSSMHENSRKFFYYAGLTDTDVNNIQRDEDQTLHFFTLPEVEKLTLTSSTRMFIASHRDFLESSHN